VGAAIYSNARCLLSYSKGEIKAEECDCNDPIKREVNHAVTLVGYGKSQRPDCNEYWLIKNSWGPTWGEGGFFKLCSDVNIGKAPNGTC
jgi:C1A family cysteine protease